MNKEELEKLFYKFGLYVLFESEGIFDNLTGEQVRKIKEFFEKELLTNKN